MPVVALPGESRTVDEACDDALHYLSHDYRATLNILGGSVGAADTVFALVHDPVGVTVGTVLGVGVEELFVTGVAGQDVTVVRGFGGSTADEHEAGVFVTVNPKFSRFRVCRFLRDEVRSWFPTLFAVDTVTLASVSTGSWYGSVAVDLAGVPAGFYRVLSVQFNAGSGSWLDVQRFRVERDMPPAEFPSGSALLLDHPLRAARDLRVTYGYAFNTDSWGAGTDLVSDVGLAEWMVDIPALGAAARMMVGREVPRTFGAGQPEPRRAGEVPPGHVTSARLDMLRERDRRVDAAYRALLALYPPRGW